MRGKVAREIRSAMKAQGQDVMADAQYFIAKTKKVMVYVLNEETQKPEAKIVDRIQIVNGTKNKYRKVKKMLKAQRKNGLAA